MPETEQLVRRAVALATVEPGVATGWLEDNFHHFGVRLAHDGGKVRDVQVMTERYPWTTCAGAGDPARDIVGLDLVPRAEMLGAELPMSLHCTHVFELAGLVMAHIQRGEADRFIEMAVTRAASASADGDSDIDGGEGGDAQAMACTWTCNGIAGERLVSDKGKVLAPDKFAGQPLYKGFRRWSAEHCAPVAEQLWLMRRVLWLAAGADMFTPRAVADDTGLGHVCHTYQPEQRCKALSIANSRIDVNDPATVLLADHRGRQEHG